MSALASSEHPIRCLCWHRKGTRHSSRRLGGNQGELERRLAPARHVHSGPVRVNSSTGMGRCSGPRPQRGNGSGRLSST